MDTRSGTFAQVMGRVGPQVQVRLPGGEREWEVPPGALRLATGEERRAATGARRCGECDAIRAGRRAAEARGDRSAMSDAAVLMGRHLREAHP
ncbi:hypothetical protein AB0F13_08100 [Streptomyces sp. NPDC026206]|uniref:hypothetical protein n=1 Tax=Streptomyces sp. NPDC026206 TaxID=3157089 RepID=UPI0033E7FE87